MDLAASPALDYARDIFMLSFFTRGMSFIDMAFILKTDLNNGYLTYSRHKTAADAKTEVDCRDVSA